jgi:hypothetical protein
MCDLRENFEEKLHVRNLLLDKHTKLEEKKHS